MIKLTCQWRYRGPAISPGKARLRVFVDRAAQLAGLPLEPAWNLQILFVGDRDMACYNRELVGHEGTTDVITYNYFECQEDYVAGDTMVELIVNPDAAVREGKMRGGFARELALYIVHGLLHCAGEDDLTEAAIPSMRRREAECLAVLEREFDLSRIFAQNVAD